MNSHYQFIAFTLLLFFLNANDTFAADIQECEAYKEKAVGLKCDENHYLYQFGYHYCRLFVEDESVFSKEGAIILQDIRTCLISEMNSDNEMSCENAKSRASDHHVKCYIEKNFCDLPFFDKISVYNRIYKELEDPQFKEAYDKIKAACER